MYRMNSMLTNTLKKRKLRNCMLWDRTYLNDKNPCNIYLYIKQKNNSSTRPISIKPYQYLSKLSEHNIDPQSLHIYDNTIYWYDNLKNKTFSMNAKGLSVKKLIRNIHLIVYA
eukprot:470247_1